MNRGVVLLGFLVTIIIVIGSIGNFLLEEREKAKENNIQTHVIMLSDFEAFDEYKFYCKSFKITNLGNANVTLKITVNSLRFTGWFNVELCTFVLVPNESKRTPYFYNEYHGIDGFHYVNINAQSFDFDGALYKVFINFDIEGNYKCVRIFKFSDAKGAYLVPYVPFPNHNDLNKNWWQQYLTDEEMKILRFPSEW